MIISRIGPKITKLEEELVSTNQQDWKCFLMHDREYGFQSSQHVTFTDKTYHKKAVRYFSNCHASASLWFYQRLEPEQQQFTNF